MKYTAATASVVGGGDTNNWSQTFTSHNLFVAVEVRGVNPAISGTSFLREIQSRIENSSLQSLSEFKSFLDRCAQEHPITYVAALLVGDVIYFRISQKGTVWIARDNKIVPVLTSSGTASGRIKSEDKILLASERLVQILAKEDLEILFNQKNPQAMVETIAPKLHNQATAIVASGVIIQATSTAEAQKRSVHLKVFNIFDKFASTLPRISTAKLKSIRLKPLTIIITLLVLVLLTSIGVEFKKKQASRQEQRLNETLSQVSHKFEEGTALIELNPIRARELLGEAKAMLETELKGSANKETQLKLEQLLEQVNAGMTQALRRFDISLTPFFELDLVKPGGEGTATSLFQDTLAILDTKNKSLYTLNIESKSSRIVAGGEALNNAEDLTVYDGEIFVIARKVLKVAPQAVETVLEEDAAWGEITSVASFGGNIYLLDSKNNQIWKYVRNDTGFSDTTKYLETDVEINLSQAKNLVIDGSVWLTQGESIMRFTQGVQDAWSIKGLDEALGNDISLFVDEDLVQVYILDRQKKRVVVVDKDGVYLSQYRWQEDKRISDIVVSEGIKKILLLASDTIYAIEL